MPTYSNKSIMELESDRWEEPGPDASYLIRTCHRLRQAPLRDLEAEDLRMLIGQGIGLPWIIPIALDMLEVNPLKEGHYFPGDLLVACLGRHPRNFWVSRPDLRDRLARIANNIDRLQLTEAPPSLSEVIPQWIEATAH
ncbi:contact-dependent growth inhibition system immunity protein [Salininema proteolyticum]|uniref:Contact-dependent growth inhibition system immunity protein n=1 Tax=Salininema proteolyticum TaxID=1607685 RepID=A0ABV8TUP4_9ACTN